MTAARFVGARTRDRETCTVTLENASGEREEITLPVADLGAMVKALAGLAAVAAQARPALADTAVADAHLPVLQWRTGFSNVNREPVLILETPGVSLTYQMPATTATAIGQALIAEGQRAAPSGRPN